MSSNPIQSAINRSGLTQAEVCRRSGLRPATVCEAYTGRRAPRSATIARIALAIGADPDALITAVRAEDDAATQVGVSA